MIAEDQHNAKREENADKSTPQSNCSPLQGRRNRERNRRGRGIENACHGHESGHSNITKAMPLHTTKAKLGASSAKMTMPNLVQLNVQVQEIPSMSSGSSQGMLSLNHFSRDPPVKAKLPKLTFPRFRGR